MKVVDTSFMIEAVKKNIPIIGKILVPGSVYRELRAMARNKGRKGSYARAALEIIAKDGYIIPSNLEPDQAAVEIANKYDLELLTFDLRLRSMANRKGEIKGKYVEY